MTEVWGGTLGSLNHVETSEMNSGGHRWLGIRRRLVLVLYWQSLHFVVYMYSCDMRAWKLWNFMWEVVKIWSHTS